MKGTGIGTRTGWLAGVLVVWAGLLFAPVAFATHLRAGEITVERLNCSRTFRITITVYTNTGSPIRFGDGILDYGDGSAPFITPLVENVPRPDLGPNVAQVVFTIEHTFPGNGRYIISYSEPNRNAGILNMAQSVDTRFYLETVVNIDPFLGCSNSPRLLVPPIDKACTGAAWFHNPGAFDPDGDSLSYELTVPKRDRNLAVNNYRAPNAREFYDRIGKPFNQSNETGNGPPTFSIDARTGTLIWDAPGAPGEYNIAFLIREWRRIGGVWINTGYVTRDMQIIVEDCNNRRPELEVPADICVEAGTVINQDIFGTDPDFHDVRIEVFSQVLSIQPSPATFTPNPPTFQQTTAGQRGRVNFVWATRCEHVKDQPYQVVFKITDRPPTGPALVQFKTWNIRVVGPAPTWVSATTNLANRSANLNWDSYTCQNAVNMQVWRRVDQFNFTPPECLTGMPDFLGYTQIATVPIGTTSFVDTNGGQGLANGARYCYRLVAIFPQPAGGESYVSQEICLDPIRADVPVITQVTVDETGTSTGAITIQWREPFQVDPAQFPPPYRYEVFRAQGLTGEVGLVKPHPGRLDVRTYTDTGLNTEDFPFNYRIACYDNNNVLVGTSVPASSVFLELRPQFRRIVLSWTASVPWSNNTQSFPYHRIYRGPANATNAQMILIDSVQVNQLGLQYIDSGQYQNTPLLETEEYCYRIRTSGSYGNPLIVAPLLNFSQRSCAQPTDDQAPCAVALEPAGVNCTEFLQSASCNQTSNVYSNTLNWRRPPDPVCRADIRSYNVYAASRVGQAFELIATNVRDTVYVDRDLPSFARCYKISAVDRAGNESELSEAVCFDNCPYYELPNVLTPNGDNCNDLFSAFSIRFFDESGTAPCGGDLNQLTRRCARFVLGVDFKVYNRWGNEVYRYRSGAERSIYIDWDGKDSNGRDLASGVYFYTANVTFDVVDPARQRQEIKGWVHLIR